MTKRVSRKLSIVSAIAMAVVVFGAATATGHTNSFNTDIVPESFNTTGGHGHVTSGNQKCLPRRTVKFSAVDNGGTFKNPNDDVRTLLDVDRTSSNGAFYLKGNSPAGTDYWLVRVTTKNIGRPGHRHTCEGLSDFFS